MESYENYQVSKWGEYCAKKFKARKFTKKYFDENGTWPSVSAIAAASVLTAEEMEELKRSEYAGRYAKQAEVSAPEEEENTEEQEATAQDIVDQINSGERNIVADGEVKNISLPSDMPSSVTITGEFVDNATIKSESTKSVTIVNTNEEPIDISVESNGTVYLQGKYNDVYLNGKVSVASSIYPEIEGNVTVDPSFNENMTIAADFGDDASVNYYGDKKVTVSNVNDPANMVVNAPSATVDMRGQYGDVEVTAGDNTLLLYSNFHAQKLSVKKGNVIYYGVSLDDFVDEIETAQGVEVGPNTVYIDATNFSKVSSDAGVYELTCDVEKASAIAFGLFASGKRRLNLNDHSMRIGTERNGSIFMRGSATLDICGGGSIENMSNGYGVWVASKDCTLNVYGGEFNAFTHTIYVQNGVANIYGGVFKIKGNYDTDAKGHAKFLLNCYDSSYQSGDAKINVFGGKFYNFNPAESYGEPGGPVSFVAEGYHVVETEENGVPVFEVVQD